MYSYQILTRVLETNSNRRHDFIFGSTGTNLKKKVIFIDKGDSLYNIALRIIDAEQL